MKSTQETVIALSYTSSNSNAPFMLSNLCTYTNSYLHECKLMIESIINFYLLEISLQVIAAPHILIWNTLVANSILKVLLDGIVGKVYASDYFKDINSSVF